MTRDIEFMGRRFGDGHYIDDKAIKGTFYPLLEQRSWKLLAETLGWSEGCPVVPKVIERNGAKAAAETYAELLLTRQIQLDIINNHNPQLAAFINWPKRRVDSEIPGDFVEGYVPYDHDNILRPPATLVGYNLPRLTREFIGPRIDEAGNQARTQERILTAFSIFEQVVESSTELRHTTIQFMVRLAEYYAIVDKYNPRKYLPRLLSAGKIEEDNLWTDAAITLDTARAMNSCLYHAYFILPAEQRRALGIANLS